MYVFISMRVCAKSTRVLMNATKSKHPCDFSSRLKSECMYGHRWVRLTVTSRSRACQICRTL